MRQPAMALVLVLVHSAEGAIWASKAAARPSKPGITYGARLSMTCSQFPSLASMRVAAERSDVSM